MPHGAKHIRVEIYTVLLSAFNAMILVSKLPQNKKMASFNLHFPTWKALHAPQACLTYAACAKNFKRLIARPSSHVISTSPGTRVLVCRTHSWFFNALLRNVAWFYFSHRKGVINMAIALGLEFSSISKLKKKSLWSEMADWFVPAPYG